MVRQLCVPPAPQSVCAAATERSSQSVRVAERVCVAAACVCRRRVVLRAGGRTAAPPPWSTFGALPPPAAVLALCWNARRGGSSSGLPPASASAHLPWRPRAGLTRVSPLPRAFPQASDGRRSASHADLQPHVPPRELPHEVRALPSVEAPSSPSAAHHSSPCVQVLLLPHPVVAAAPLRR